MSRQVFPRLSSYKLGNIIESLHLEGINSHDALDDTRATVQLALRLDREIRNGADRRR